jgi:hypothetical protein
VEIKAGKPPGPFGFAGYPVRGVLKPARYGKPPPGPIIEIMRFHAFFLLCVCLCAAPAAAQEAGVSSAPEAEGGQALPRRFRGLSLGMSLEELKAGLAGDGLFNFRGDRDVSFLPRRDESLVETTGASFVRRAFFQLKDGEVFIMGFALNTALVDHYSVFRSFTKKYGEPSYLDPGQAVWETAETRVSIERPLTIKYIDKGIFDRLAGEQALEESGELQMRQEFLDEL